MVKVLRNGAGWPCVGGAGRETGEGRPLSVIRRVRLCRGRGGRAWDLGFLGLSCMWRRLERGESEGADSEEKPVAASEIQP